jgi:thioesterase domain-containing protein
MFAFPPHLGYGLFYTELAKQIQTHSFYSFDFIPDESRLKLYAAAISGVQKKGPYVFLGYSSGGRLAFETAKYLQEIGQNVSDVIIVDIKANNTASDNDQEIFTREDAENAMLEFRRLNAEIWNEDFAMDKLVDEVHKTTSAYGEYLKNLFIQEKINANIHFIKSIENENSGFETEWRNFTNGKFAVYQGEGSHVDMFNNPEHLSKNAEIINKILERDQEI